MTGDAGEPRFRVVLPATWAALPLEAPDRKDRLRRLVRDRMGRADELAAERYELALMLERWAREVQAAGAFFAATYEELWDGLPVSATLVVTRSNRPTPPHDDPATIVDELSQQYGSMPDGAVSIVELRMGPAVRVRERRGCGLEGSDGTELVTESLQFSCPLPGTDELVILTFSTPTLPLADRFVELFDAIAATARLDVV